MDQEDYVQFSRTSSDATRVGETSLARIIPVIAALHTTLRGNRSVSPAGEAAPCDLETTTST